MIWCFHHSLKSLFINFYVAVDSNFIFYLLKTSFLSSNLMLFKYRADYLLDLYVLLLYLVGFMFFYHMPFQAIAVREILSTYRAQKLSLLSNMFHSFALWILVNILNMTIEYKFLFKSLIAIFALERKLVWERVILIFLGGIINLWMIVS